MGREQWGWKRSDLLFHGVKQHGRIDEDMHVSGLG